MSYGLQTTPNSRASSFYSTLNRELSRSETIEREFSNLLKIKDNYPKIVVAGERSFENSYEGIKHVYILDFLTKFK